MFAISEKGELAALWGELVAGTCKIESSLYDPGTWAVVVTHDPEPAFGPLGRLRTRDAEILEQALIRGVRKSVAVEAGLSCSSVAVILQSCFHFMGLSCLPSRIPPLLVAAAHARLHHDSGGWTGARPVPGTKFLRQKISVARPDTALAAWLAPAEHAVVGFLVEGKSYAEIARLRETSVRTVANQIASAFRRLGVSGRSDLLCLLARWGLESAPPVRRVSSGGLHAERVIARAAHA